MTTYVGLAAARWIAESGGLGESILTELSMRKYGYSAHLTLQVVIDSSGRPLTDPYSVLIDVSAVDELHFVGALTPYTRDHPEEIDWGLSEIALVRITHFNSRFKVEILWESDRQVVVVGSGVSIEVAE